MEGGAKTPAMPPLMPCRAALCGERNPTVGAYGGALAHPSAPAPANAHKSVDGSAKEESYTRCARPSTPKKRGGENSQLVCHKDTPFSPHLRTPSRLFGRCAPSPLLHRLKGSASRPDSPRCLLHLHPFGHRRGREAMENFTSTRRNCAEMRACSLFFTFECFHTKENALYLQRKPILSSLCSKTSG